MNLFVVGGEKGKKRKSSEFEEYPADSEETNPRCSHLEEQDTKICPIPPTEDVTEIDRYSFSYRVCFEMLNMLIITLQK